MLKYSEYTYVYTCTRTSGMVVHVYAPAVLLGTLFSTSKYSEHTSVCYTVVHV